jgi:hypothetical protein
MSLAATRKAAGAEMKFRGKTKDGKPVYTTDAATVGQRREAGKKLKAAGYSFGTRHLENGISVRGWCKNGGENS